MKPERNFRRSLIFFMNQKRRYKEKRRFYPEAVLADKIYRTRENDKKLLELRKYIEKQQYQPYKKTTFKIY